MAWQAQTAQDPKGKPITMLTNGNIDPGVPLVKSHKIVVLNVAPIPGTANDAVITAFNEWGYDGAGDDGNAGDGIVTFKLSAARFSISCFTTCTNPTFPILAKPGTAPTPAPTPPPIATPAPAPVPEPIDPPVQTKPAPDPTPVTPAPKPTPSPTPAPIVRMPYVLSGPTSTLPSSFVAGWYELGITSLDSTAGIPRVVVSVNGIAVAEIYPHEKARMMLAGTHYFQPGNTVAIQPMDKGFVLKSAVLNPLPIVEGA
jgi:hypothetical protein